MAGIIVGVLVTILGGLGLQWATKALEPEANPNAITAEIHAGPWIPFPGQPTIRDNTALTSPESMAEQSTTKRAFPIARYDFLNPGSKRVDDIRFELPQYSLNTSFLVRNGQISDPIPAGREIKIGQMAPGDRATLYTFGFSSEVSSYSLRSVQSYSSEGPIRFTAYKHVPDVESDPNIVLELAKYFGIPVLIGILIIMIAFWNYVFKYIRRLLSDEQYYDAEKVRYDADPKGFQIDIK